MYWQVEEVLLDQLVEPGDERFPVQNNNPPEQQAEEIQAEENHPQANDLELPNEIQAEEIYPQADDQQFPNENEFFEAIIAEND